MKQSNQTTHRLAQRIMRSATVKTFSVILLILACFRTGQIQAQTAVLCDPRGDAKFNGGKGGPAVPPWLDIIRAEVTENSPDEILFTMTLNAPIPTSPAWKSVDDGGQLWWGFRMVNDLASDFTVKNGCIKGAGQYLPGGYFLDLIWDVPTSTFQARLLDDTSCVATAVPFSFSDDRTQVILVLAKSLLANQDLIPDPDQFQFFAATVAWKANATGNNSFFDLDFAPDATTQLEVVNWSAASNAIYDCP